MDPAAPKGWVQRNLTPALLRTGVAIVVTICAPTLKVPGGGATLPTCRRARRTTGADAGERIDGRLRGRHRGRTRDRSARREAASIAGGGVCRTPGECRRLARGDRGRVRRQGRGGCGRRWRRGAARRGIVWGPGIVPRLGGERGGRAGHRINPRPLARTAKEGGLGGEVQGVRQRVRGVVRGPVNGVGQVIVVTVLDCQWRK